MNQQSKVSIRPQVTMLSVLKHIEYETWFALAEFIDNAVDSYLKNEKILKQIEGDDFVLDVRVEINEPENKITLNSENSEKDSYKEGEIIGICEVLVGDKKVGEVELYCDRDVEKANFFENIKYNLKNLFKEGI